MEAGVVAVPAARVAIIAALPREVAVLVKHVRPEPSLRSQGIALYRVNNAVVATAGMGAERVTLALDAALRICKAELIVSTGLAGACDPELTPGFAIEATEVVDTQTGERYATDAPQGKIFDERLSMAEPRNALVLASSSAIASVPEKSRLHAAYNAAAVDMEAATVARLARARGIPFRAIKGISDAHDFELEGMNRFTGTRGQFRTGRFALHTAMRPWTWRKAVELGGGSKRALDAMTALLRAVMEEHKLR
jgi:adenosylhomocysteine nucleosidase